MASRPIREVQGLNIVYKHINSDQNENGGVTPVKYFAIENQDDLDKAAENHPWILQEVRHVFMYYKCHVMYSICKNKIRNFHQCCQMYQFI